MHWNKILVLITLFVVTGFVGAQPIKVSLTPNIFHMNAVNYGQTLHLVAELYGPKLPDAKNIELTLTINELNKTLQFSKESQERYVLDFKIPENKNYQYLTLFLNLRADIGVPYVYSKSHKLMLTDELYITFIKPSLNLSQKVAEISEPLDEIEVRVLYHNFSPFDKNAFYAKVHVDGREELVKFEKTDQQGIYIGHLSKPITPQNKEVTIKLFGAFSGGISIKIREKELKRIVIIENNAESEPEESKEEKEQPTNNSLPFWLLAILLLGILIAAFIIRKKDTRI